MWLLLAMIGGREVYLDTFQDRTQCRLSLTTENLIERSLQIDGEPQCRQFIRVTDEGDQ